MMTVRQKLSPGQRGNQKIGKDLRRSTGLRVRYRYDAQRKKRYKTVELVIAEGDWQPIAADATDDGPG